MKRISFLYYYNKKTIDTENKLDSYELEVLAIINALEKLRVYLLGIKFKLVMDCEALKKTLETLEKKLSSKIAR